VKNSDYIFGIRTCTWVVLRMGRAAKPWELGRFLEKQTENDETNLKLLQRGDDDNS
jgi:hypothetical protein